MHQSSNHHTHRPRYTSNNNLSLTPSPPAMQPPVRKHNNRQQTRINIQYDKIMKTIQSNKRTTNKQNKHTDETTEQLSTKTFILLKERHDAPAPDKQNGHVIE